MDPLLTWLIQGAVGPALVVLPVTGAASDLTGSAMAGQASERSRTSAAVAHEKPPCDLFLFQQISPRLSILHHQ